MVRRYPRFWHEQPAAANEGFVAQTPERKLYLARTFSNTKEKVLDHLSTLTSAEE